MSIFKRKSHEFSSGSAEVNPNAAQWENMAEAAQPTPEYKYQPSDADRAKHVRKILTVAYTGNINALSQPAQKDYDRYLDDFMDAMNDGRYSEKSERMLLDCIAKPRIENLSEEEQQFANQYKTVRDYEDYENMWANNMSPEEKSAWLKESSIKKHNIYGKQVEYSEDLKFLRGHANHKHIIQEKNPSALYHLGILDNN